MFRQHCLQRGLVHDCIGKDIDQHRGHIRRNHPRTLGNPSDRDCFRPDLDLCSGTFWKGIGGHNRLGGVRNATRIKLALEVGQYRGHAVIGQRFTDHASGRREHPRLGNVTDLGDRCCDCFDRSHTAFSGKGIRVAGIHQNGSTCIRGATDLGLTIQNRRCPRCGFGKCTGNGGPRCQFGQHHIGAALIPDPSCDCGKPNPVNDGKVGKFLGCEGGNGSYLAHVCLLQQAEVGQHRWVNPFGGGAVNISFFSHLLDRFLNADLTDLRFKLCLYFFQRGRIFQALF